MNRNTWKQGERRTAAAFGSKRNPLSGRNGKHSRSDTLHPKLYLECKHTKASALHSLFTSIKLRADKEKKTPVLVSRQTHSKLVLVTCLLDDLPTVAAEYVSEKRKCPKCGSAGEIFTSDLDWCPKCKHQWTPK